MTEDYCEKWDMPASTPGWEEWRAIPSFPSYLASSLGRIYSLPREHTKGGVLKARISKRKYREVRLHRTDGYSRTCRVHALVCEAFNGTAPERQGVRHLDGDSLNNLATNLCWGTQAENLEDARRHGTMPRGGQMAICEKTDLDEAYCAHCRGNTKTPEEQAEIETAALRKKLLATDPRWFPAQYPGVCACGTGFGPGTLIRQPSAPDFSWVAECCSGQ